MPDASDERQQNPTLNDGEQRDVREHKGISAFVVYEVIRREGQEQLERPALGLGWSGLAAGLAMGFSFVGEALLHARLPDTEWRPLVTNLGYSVGFLIVILGKQELFTENTLRPVLPLLQQWSGARLLNVMRVWVVVLLSNLLGALLFAWVLASTNVFLNPEKEALREIGQHAIQGSFADLLVRGVFAGWLIALLVWVLPFAQNSRVSVIVIITFLVGLGGLAHSIAGSTEVLYLVLTGAASWGTYLLGFLAPALLGNIVGGVSLVALLNYGQVYAGRGADGEASS